MMVEDMIPAPKISFYGNQPLSAVPVHLSLTGESVRKGLTVTYTSANINNYKYKCLSCS